MNGNILIGGTPAAVATAGGYVHRAGHCPFSQTFGLASDHTLGLPVHDPVLAAHAPVESPIGFASGELVSTTLISPRP